MATEENSNETKTTPKAPAPVKVFDPTTLKLKKSKGGEDVVVRFGREVKFVGGERVVKVNTRTRDYKGTTLAQYPSYYAALHADRSILECTDAEWAELEKMNPNDVLRLYRAKG